ncbi:MAG TPA: hypothetical protein VJ761_09830, partial [Ktedonobacteraceae bacterium]|nr:hypothetical protein [Ktedonobacteraceae bacterium]
GRVRPMPRGFNPTIGLHAIPTAFYPTPHRTLLPFQSHHRASCHSDVLLLALFLVGLHGFNPTVGLHAIPTAYA